MPKLKPRPTIIPQIETDELSAIFRRKWGKRARVQAAEQGSEDLPATDDAAKESLITLKVNLLNPVVRLVRGVADLEQIRSKLRAAYSNLADLIDRITPKQWAGLVEKGMRFARQDIDAFIRRVKGGLLELNFHYSQSLNTLRRLCESKVSQVAVPASRNWQRNVVLIEESYSIYKAGRKQFADVLFVVFDNQTAPTRAWIVAVAESKSESNAIELVSYGARPDIPDSGEFLGQLHLRSEQFDNLEIELQGYGRFKRGKNLFCGTLRKGGNVNLPWAKEDTVYVGIIPSDTDIQVQSKIKKGLDNTNSLLWQHEKITGKEAGQVAASFVNSLPFLDILSK